MNNKLQNINLRIALPVAVVCVLIIIMIVAILSGNKPTNEKAKNVIVSNPTNSVNQQIPGESNPNVIPNAQVNNKNSLSGSPIPKAYYDNWKSYEGNGYIIRFPTDWEISDNSSDNYNAITLTQQVSYYDQFSPSINVVAISNSTLTLEQRKQILFVVNFKKSQAMLGRISVEKFERDIASSQKNGIAMTETHYLLKRNSIQYEIVSRYLKGNATAEQLVFSIIQTAIFN